MASTLQVSEIPERRQRQLIGPVIHELRLQHGLTITDLAERCGISVSYISRLEKGLSVPSFTMLSRVAEALDQSSSFFEVMQHEAQTVDEQLTAALAHTKIPEAVWPELLLLSLDARKAIVGLLADQDLAGTSSATS